MQKMFVPCKWQLVTAVVCAAAVVEAVTEAGVVTVAGTEANVVIASSTPLELKQYETEPCIWHPVYVVWASPPATIAASENTDRYILVVFVDLERCSNLSVTELRSGLHML